MYNLYIWVVGFLLTIFSKQLANIFIENSVSIEQICLLALGLILMLLSPKTI